MKIENIKETLLPVEKVRDHSNYLTLHERSYDPEKKEFLMEVQAAGFTMSDSELIQMRFEDCVYVEESGKQINSKYSENFPEDISHWGMYLAKEIDSIEVKSDGLIQTIKNLEDLDRYKVYYFAYIEVIYTIVCKEAVASPLKN